MKSIKIFGLIGENLGDEILGISAYNEICKTFPNTKIGELIANRAARNNGVQSFFIDRKSIKGIYQLIKAIEESDVVVVGGGSLIQDKLGISIFRGTLPFLFQIVLIAKLLGKKVISLPLGVDQLNTKMGKFFALCSLKAIDYVCVRDELSQKNACEYGNLTYDKVRVMPDPAFLFDTTVSKCTHNYIVISLVKENYDTSYFIPALTEFIEHMLSKGFKIKLLSMDERITEEHELNRKIFDLMQNTSVEIVPLGQSIDSICHLIRSAKLVVAMRLHAAIIAYGYANILMISRTTKTDAFRLQYDVKGLNMTKPIQGSSLITLSEEIGEFDYLVHKEKLDSIRNSIELDYTHII